MFLIPIEVVKFSNLFFCDLFLGPFQHVQTCWKHSGDYAAGFQNGFIQIQGRLGILLTIYDHLELIGYKLRLMCWLLGAAWFHDSTLFCSGMVFFISWWINHLFVYLYTIHVNSFLLYTWRRHACRHTCIFSDICVHWHRLIDFAMVSSCSCMYFCLLLPIRRKMWRIFVSPVCIIPCDT